MKATQKFITTTLLVVSLGLFGIIAMGGDFSFGANATSIPYQDTVDVQFTFNPSMTVTLSATALSIDNLAPNTSGMSSPMTVAVATNDLSGYTLKATVGSAQNQTANLVLDANNRFEMISASGALSAGKWGYTVNAGTTYKPIATYGNSATTINSSDSPTNGSTTGVTSFSIGAYAAAGQASGDYTNVINFTVVANTPDA